MVQRIFFILSLIANALYAFFLWNLLFNFIKSRLFFPVKAYCVYMVNKIIDGRLQISNFSSRVYLFYILLLDTLLVRCSRSRDNKLNIWREIPYQSAPKYFSLFIEWGKNSRVCHTASIQNPLNYIQRISMRDCGAIAQWSLFIQPCNHRLLTTKKVVDECKAIKLVNKCSRKNFPGLESFNCEKVFCVVVELKWSKYFFFDLSRYAWKTLLEPIAA